MAIGDWRLAIGGACGDRCWWRALLLFLLLTGLTGCVGDEAAAQSSVGPLETSLRQRLSSASLGEDGVWIGYGLRIPLDPNVLLIRGIPLSWNSGSLEFGGSYLRNLIDPSAEPNRQLSIAPGERQGDKVLREVAILLGYTHDRELDQLLLVNQDLPVDLGEREFIWLGSAEPDESVALLEHLFQETTETRNQKEILSSIGWHQTARAESLLRQVLEEEEVDLEVRQEAVRGFRHFPTAESVELLRQLAANAPEAKVQAEAISVLARSPVESATPALIGLLDPSGEEKLQARLVRSLARREEEPALRALIGIVESGTSEELRKEAVSALAHYQPPELIRERLDSWALRSDSSVVRRTAVEQLGRRFLPEAKQALLRVIREDADPKVVSQAVQALRRLPEREAAQELGGLATTDARAEVRLEAVRNLGRLELEQEVKPLEEIAFSDSESRVQAAAVQALRRIPGEAAVDSLIRISEKHPRAEIRRAAVREMARIAGDRVAEKVESLARRDPDRRVQAEAVSTLGKIGSEGTIEALARIARDHPVYEIRRRAIQVLGRSKSPAARAVLIELANSNSNR